MWAAGVLAKVLPDDLFAKERVALFLRADNNLYQSVNNRWLSLDFYDLLAPFQAQLKLLQQRAPTIIVAPAQVLRALALEVMAGELTLKVKKVISVAEVLEPQDRELLRNVFHNVGEIYQATEGFLASPAGVERYISTKSLFTLNRNGWMSTVSCRSSQTLPAPHSR